jgi:hypothetical protein
MPNSVTRQGFVLNFRRKIGGLVVQLYVKPVVVHEI